MKIKASKFIIFLIIGFYGNALIPMYEANPIHVSGTAVERAQRYEEGLRQQNRELQVRDNEARSIARTTRTPEQQNLDRLLKEEAMSGRNLNVITRLLEQGADPNTHDNDKITPLHNLVHFAKIEAIKALLRAGADPDARNIVGETPIGRAISMSMTYGNRPEYAEMQRLMLMYGAQAEPAQIVSSIADPFERAAAAQDRSEIQRLLDENVGRPQTSRPLSFAVGRGNQEIVNLLLPNASDEDIREAWNVANALVIRNPHNARYEAIRNAIRSRYEALATLHVVPSTSQAFINVAEARASGDLSFSKPAPAQSMPPVPTTQEGFEKNLREITEGKRPQEKEQGTPSWKQPTALGALIAGLVAAGAGAGQYVKEYLYPKKNGTEINTQKVN